MLYTEKISQYKLYETYVPFYCKKLEYNEFITMKIINYAFVLLLVTHLFVHQNIWIILQYFSVKYIYIDI